MKLWSFLKGLILKPETTDSATDSKKAHEGAIWVDDVSGSNKLKSHLDGSSREVATLDQVQVLSNKSTSDGFTVGGDLSTDTIDDLSGAGLSITADTTITGNLTVTGTSEVVIKDENITLNSTGDDASSEGSGITIERTSTDGSLIYADASASKFNIGALGSEKEIITDSDIQKLQNKTIVDSVDNTKEISIDASAITTLTTRTITMPDSDVDLSDVALNNAHRDGGANKHDASEIDVEAADGGNHAAADLETVIGTLDDAITSNASLAAAAATKELDNLGTTAVNVDINPVTDAGAGAIDLGGFNNRWGTVSAREVDSSSVTLRDYTTEAQLGTLGYNPTDGILLGSQSSSTVDANPTKDSTIYSGSKTAGTGDSGDVNLTTGTSAGGSRGDIILNGNQVDVSTSKIVNVVDGTANQDAATFGQLDAHITDAIDSHDASAISVLDTGAVYTATDVEAALNEVKVAADLNTAKVSADGLVTTHSDVTDSGSGIIISGTERTAIGTNTTNVANLETLSGVAGAVNNGTFTGTTITDNVNTKVALQDLETAVDTLTGATAGATTELDNLGTTAVNANISPASDIGASLGENIKRWEYVKARTTKTTTIDFVDNATGIVNQGQLATSAIKTTLETADNSDANVTATADTALESGNKLAGTGDSGDIILQTGTSLGGSRGNINLDANEITPKANIRPEAASTDTLNIGSSSQRFANVVAQQTSADNHFITSSAGSSAGLLTHNVDAVELSSTAATTDVDIVATRDINLNPTGDINANTNLIKNVTDPVDPQDAATRAYVLANSGGGGVGSLDSFLSEDFEVTSASDFTDGNNATFLTAGTLIGTLADEAVSPLSGTRSIKYTHHASSVTVNDWFASPSITLDPKQQSNTSGMNFVFTYDGDEGDIEVVVWDETNSKVLTSSTDLVTNTATSKRFSTSFTTASDTASVKYGFHVKVTNANKILIFDDVEMSTDPFVYKQLNDAEVSGYATNSLAQVVTADTSVIKVALNNAPIDNGTMFNIGSNRFDIKKAGRYNFTSQIVFTGIAGGSEGILYIYVNGALTNYFTRMEGVNVLYKTLSGLLDLNEGDYVELFMSSVDGTYGTGANTTYLTLSRIPQTTEHVVTPASNELINVSGAGNGGLGITANITDIDFIEVSDSGNSWDGTTFTVPRDGRYNISGSIRTTVAVALAINIYEDGSTSDIISDNGSSVLKSFNITKDFSEGTLVTLRGDVTSTLSNTSAHHYINITGVPTNTTFLAAIPTNYQNVNPNILINGDCRVNQRGTIVLDASAVAATNLEYVIDRRKVLLDTSTANMQYLSTGQPTQLSGSNSFKLIATNSVTGKIGYYETIEDFSLYKGKVVTFSAYVKSNSTNSRLLIWDGVTSHLSTPHTGSGTIEKLELTTTIDASSTILAAYTLIASSSNTAVAISSTNENSSGIAAYIEFTGAKLELGSVATEFVADSAGESLRKCQRYYEKGTVIHESYALTGTTPTTTVFYKTTKYDTSVPSLVHSAGTNTNSTPIIAGTVQDINGFGLAETVTASGTFYFTVDWEVEAEL